MMPPIPMSSPDITDAERAAVAEVLATTYLSIGPRLDAFERAVASYCHSAHAVGVNSGTSGLHLCVIAASDSAAGAGAVVTCDVPARATVVGVPARRATHRQERA